MILDKKEHKEIFLELINKASFQGESVEVVFELKQAVQSAQIRQMPNGVDGTRDGV